MERGPFDLVLMDMNYSRDTTSGDEGLALLDRLIERDGSVPVVVMTAWSSVQSCETRASSCSPSASWAKST